MNRGEDRSADDAMFATDGLWAGLNGARFDPQPEPAAAIDEPTTSAHPTPRPDERPTAARHLKPAIRHVGAPPPPDATRDPAEVALRALPVKAGVNRRRMAWVIGLAVSIWVVAVFARQVGEASAAADRADRVRADNAALSLQVAALQRERDVVQQPSFIEFQARSYGLGTAQEKRFTLANNAPPLPSNAPGSASVRLAPAPTPGTPLDSWLSLLFGPTH
jgi:hypothetical protein